MVRKAQVNSRKINNLGNKSHFVSDYLRYTMHRSYHANLSVPLQYCICETDSGDIRYAINAPNLNTKSFQWSLKLIEERSWLIVLYTFETPLVGIE